MVDPYKILVAILFVMLFGGCVWHGFLIKWFVQKEYLSHNKQFSMLYSAVIDLIGVPMFLLFLSSHEASLSGALLPITITGPLILVTLGLWISGGFALAEGPRYIRRWRLQRGASRVHPTL